MSSAPEVDPELDSSEAQARFPIVAIGGSAGAITAFRDFFSAVPADSGMAYVVILHLSPDHDSKLAEVLQLAASIPVLQVKEKVELLPDHVYVIPPNKSMKTIDGSLVLSDQVGFEDRRAPIDIFFKTLAESHRARAVSVIVSGTGADGSMGMKRVKENDGLVLVQDPSEAEFDEMPRASIATGLVDATLPVSQMPARIVSYWKHLQSISITGPTDGRALLDELATEEGETSKEELQSIAELHTVNQELKARIDELSRTNDDLKNFITATDIGTIFLDRSLRVKSFTPRARDMFSLIPTDAGRPLFDLSNNLIEDDVLRDDVHEVLERLRTIEREMQTRDGRWHLMRLLPYRTAKDRIDGVVLTFYEVTGRRSAEEALRASEERTRRYNEALEQRVGERTGELRESAEMLQAVIEASPLAIITLDRDENVSSWNKAAETMSGWKAEETQGRRFRDLFNSRLNTREPGFHARELTVRRKDGLPLEVVIWSAVLRHDDGSIRGITAIAQDVTERNRLTRERNDLLRRIVEAQEDERRRIARELHDEMGQHLTALKVGLGNLGPAASSPAVERLTQIATRIDQAIDRLTLELRPPALDDVGLEAAVTHLAHEFSTTTGIKVDIHTNGLTTRMPSTVETTLYRVIQEALTNAWKHSGAKSVSIIIERRREHAQLIIEDTGRGFDSEIGTSTSSRAAFGLAGMRERVALVGGTVNIESGTGAGTSIFVRIPLRVKS